MNQQQKTIWFNGKLVPWEQAQVHVLSHAIHYGSSVFEGIRVYETPDGPCVFRLQEHIERLFGSAKIYRMMMPYSPEQIMVGCCEVVEKNQLTSAYIRPVALIGDVGLGLSPPQDTPVNVAIAAFEWGAYLGEEGLTQGIDACISSWNRLAPNTMPTGAKAGGNYLCSQLISLEAKRHGYHEGIGLDVNGYVSEGAGENIFVVKDGKVITPQTAASILPGLTRDAATKLLAVRGIEVIEAPVAREALYLADEVFMTGTAAEIVPVRSVDRIDVGNGKRGPITEQLQQDFFGLFNGYTEDHWGWLTPVKEKSLALSA